MKIKYLLVLVLATFYIPVSAQLSKTSKNTIKKRILEKINTLRITQKVNPLKLNEGLLKASELHSFYMSKTDNLSHFQENPKYKTPKKRVEHFKKLEFDVVGENILLSSKVRFPLNKTKEKTIADAMFKQWKDSPGHYANMISPEYSFTNIGFAINKNGQIYATQVFAKKGFKIDGQLSEDAFGLTAAYGECEGVMEDYYNIVANIGNSILLEGNEIMLYEHSNYYFKKIFSGQYDGIAIDVIDQDQISCGRQNKFDISPVYDGVLLKPVYRQEILDNNIAKSDYRLISKVGEVPPHLRNKTLLLAVIIIKDKVACKYIIPSYTPRRTYELQAITPKLNDPEQIEFSNRGITSSVTVNYDFKRNAITPIEYPSITKTDQTIHSIEIKSFSSIEGNSESNQRLHKKRANTIKQHLKKTFKTLPQKIDITTKENWDHFYFQLKYNFADSLLDRSKEELKKLVVTDKIPLLPWDSLLFEQRKSVATIHFEGQLNNRSPSELLAMNLRQAVLDGNMELANKALFTFYKTNSKESALIFEDAIFSTLSNEVELVQNAAAVMTLVHTSDQQKVTKFLSTWIDRSDELSEDAIFNLVNLYTITYDQLLKRWDIPSQRLANVIHPKYVESLNSRIKTEELTLNLNLSIIKYYGQINDGPNITRAFEFISNHFKNRVTKIENSIDLVLFYNYWSSYKLTNEYLLSLFNENKLNEEALFILLNTLYYVEGSDGFDEYEKIYQRAIEVNQNRWCLWLNKERQLLRDPKMKNLYCQNCQG